MKYKINMDINIGKVVFVILIMIIMIVFSVYTINKYKQLNSINKHIMHINDKLENIYINSSDYVDFIEKIDFNYKNYFVYKINNKDLVLLNKSKIELKTNKINEVKQKYETDKEIIITKVVSINNSKYLIGIKCFKSKILISTRKDFVQKNLIPLILFFIFLIYILNKSMLKLNFSSIIIQNNLTNLIDNISESLIVINTNGIIKISNKEAREMLGFVNKNIIGLQFKKFLLSEYKERFDYIISEVISRKSSFYNINIKIKNMKDKIKKLDVNIAPIIIDNQVASVQIVAKDVTKRENLESKLLILYELNKQLRTRKDFNEIQKEIFNAIEELISLSSHSICTILLKRGGFLEVLGYKGPKVNLNKLKIKIKSDKGITSWAARNKRTINIPDVRKDKRFIDRFRHARSEIASPLIIEGEVIGVLDVETDKIGAFSNNDAIVLSAIASVAAIAINNLTLYEKIKESRDYMDDLFMSSTDAMCSLNKNGKIITWNKTAEKLYGYKFEEIKDKSYDILIPQNQLKIKELINIVRKEKRFELKGVLRQHKNKSLIPIKSKLSVLKSYNKGRTRGFIIHDVDQREKLELKRERDELLKLDKLKSEFVNIASHELRTPLTSIQGYSELLMNMSDNLTEDQLEFAKIIFDESHRLGVLINDVLDLNKMDAGKMKINIKNKSINSIIDYNITYKLAYDKDIKIIKNIPNKDIFCDYDEDRMTQVMTNLISNAVKFTDNKGEIKISLEEQADQIMIKIEDSGVGIPTKDIPFIFDKFYQSSHYMTRKEGGTGLGLAICKKIIDLHHGCITVQSEENVGTTFYVFLPKNKEQFAQCKV
jgi:PAS domain S-box-containing protein